MTTGFQSIGDNGNYQIDSSFINLALDRKGTLTTEQYTNGATTNTRPTRATLTLNDGEILALSCSEYCAVGSKVGNTVTVYADSPAGALIKYYIFKPGYTSSNTGLQVFNENSVLTFDSGWRLFDVKYILRGNTTLNLNPGREYAFVHTNMETNVQYTKVVNGIQPNVIVSFVRITSYSAVKINGPVIQSALSTVDSAATRPGPGSPPGYSRVFNNGVTPEFLIIDVTGY